MEYKQLTSEYKYDTIASAMYQREVEFFHYSFDLVNFVEMLKTSPEGPERDALQDRINQTSLQMTKVDCIYNALATQITDSLAYIDAVERMKKKRNVPLK